MALFAVIVLVVVWAVRDLYRAERGLEAFAKRDEAFDAWCEWKIRNPGVYVGLSPQGRALVLAWFEAHQESLVLNGLADKGHGDYILSHLDDFPPKSPCSFPRPLRKSGFLYESGVCK